MLKETGELRPFFHLEDQQRATDALQQYNKATYGNWNGTYDGSGPGQRTSAALSNRAYDEAIAAQAAREINFKLATAEEAQTEQDQFTQATTPFETPVYIAP